MKVNLISCVEKALIEAFLNYDLNDETRKKVFTIAYELNKILKEHYKIYVVFLPISEVFIIRSIK